MINEKNPIGFGRNPAQRLPTIYDNYIGKEIRIDVSGNVGGIGVVSDVYVHKAGHIMHLSPYINWENKIPSISNEEAMIVTNGSSLTVYPLGKTLEEYVENNMPDAKEEKDSNI